MNTTFICSLPLDTYSGCVLFETRLGPRLYWLGILVDSFSSPMEIPGSHVVDVKTTFFHIPPNLSFTNHPIINAVTCQNTRRHIPDDSHIHGIQTYFSIKIGLFLCWVEQIWASVIKLLHCVFRHITTYVLARYNYHIKMSTCDASRINISETWRERASNTMDLLRSYEDVKLKTDLSGTHAYTDPLWEAKLHQVSNTAKNSPTLYGSVVHFIILQTSFCQQTYVYRISECPKRNIGNSWGCISHYQRCITLIFIALISPT